MIESFDRCRRLTLLLVLLAAIWPAARGEMRKSWQQKSVDSQTQLLKAARLEDPPSAKPPEPIVEMRAVEEPGTTQRTTTSSTGPVQLEEVSGAKIRTPQGVHNKSAQFSSRVRSKYGVVTPVAPPKPIDSEPVRTEGERDRTVPLHLEHNPDEIHLEHNPDEIQVDDATVQDDDEDDDEDEDDDDDILGWEGAKHGKEFDLIENILEEVEGRVKQNRQPERLTEEEQQPDTAGANKRRAEERTKEYTFPPVLNMTIDEPNNIVRVKLNQDVVRDMLSTGRQGGGIGGKKMLRYILPLFILPFLIQSAVIPFMLTAVKLFLLKSLMAGKLAIFLLLLGAFKNFTKKDRDVYVKDVPDRRYEPSSEGFAYLAEGRPSNWVN